MSSIFDKLKRKIFGNKHDDVNDRDYVNLPNNLDDIVNQLQDEDRNDAVQRAQKPSPTFLEGTPMSKNIRDSYGQIGASTGLAKTMPMGYSHVDFFENLDKEWKKCNCIKLNESLAVELTRFGYGAQYWLQCKCGQQFTYYPMAVWNEKIGQYCITEKQIPIDNVTCPACKAKKHSGDANIDELRKEISEQIDEIKHKNGE